MGGFPCVQMESDPISDGAPTLIIAVPIVAVQ
jgi:hypothetical protein